MIYVDEREKSENGRRCVFANAWHNEDVLTSGLWLPKDLALSLSPIREAKPRRLRK